MTIEQIIMQAMSRMIERKLNIESVSVTSWEEEFEEGYSDGCDTCGYGADDGTYKVFIYYTHSGSPTYNTLYTHEGSFAELIRELDNVQS